MTVQSGSAESSESDSQSPPTDVPTTPAEIPPAPKERVFTQAEVNKIVSERLAKDRARRESSEPNQDELKALTEQNETLLRQNQELSRLLTEEQQRRETAEQAKRIADRDALLREALAKSGCVDVRVAERFIQSDISQNPDGDWVVRTQDGRTLPISPDSISKLLPDYLKKPSVRGGAGTSAPVQRSSRQSQLDKETQELERLRARAAARPQDTHRMVQYTNQKRFVEELKKRGMR